MNFLNVKRMADCMLFVIIYILQVQAVKHLTIIFISIIRHIPSSVLLDILLIQSHGLNQLLNYRYIWRLYSGRFYIRYFYRAHRNEDNHHYYQNNTDNDETFRSIILFKTLSYLNPPWIGLGLRRVPKPWY